MSSTKSTAVGVLFILFASFISCEEEETAPLTIEPFRLTIEVSNDAVFHCLLTKSSDLAHFSWFYPDFMTEVEPESNSTRIYVDSESKLHIRNAQENDTGTYLCQVTFHDNSSDTVPPVTFTSPTTVRGDATVTRLQDSSSTYVGVTSATFSPTAARKNRDLREIPRETVEMLNATVSLKVYVMPTYFTEGMIILAINLGLLLVFLICLTQSLISEKKRMQLYYKN